MTSSVHSYCNFGLSLTIIHASAQLQRPSRNIKRLPLVTKCLGRAECFHFPESLTLRLFMCDCSSLTTGINFFANRLRVRPRMLLCNQMKLASFRYGSLRHTCVCITQHVCAWQGGLRQTNTSSSAGRCIDDNNGDSAASRVCSIAADTILRSRSRNEQSSYFHRSLSH